MPWYHKCESKRYEQGRKLTSSRLWAEYCGKDLLLNHGRGFTLFNTETWTAVSSYCEDDFGAPAGHRKVPRQCGFLENKTRVVFGSRTGDVPIYHRSGGHPRTILPHGSPAETIAVSACDQLWTSAEVVIDAGLRIQEHGGDRIFSRVS
jgi:hypothetical protein